MSTQNWIKMSERKPMPADLPVLLETRLSINGARYFVVAHSMDSVDGMAACGNYERWLRIPAPPKEETQYDKDEQALRHWCAEHNFNPLFTERKYWHAALAYERAEVERLLPSHTAILLSHGEFAESLAAIRARCGGAK